MNLIELSVFAPDRTLVHKEQVVSVRLTTTEGEIQILPEHLKMVGVLRPGLFEFERPENPESKLELRTLRGFISNGYFEVSDNKCVVLAETLEKDSEIDLERAIKAQVKAEKTFAATQAEESWTEEAYEKTARKYERSLARQGVAGQVTGKKGDRKPTSH